MGHFIRLFLVIHQAKFYRGPLACKWIHHDTPKNTAKKHTKNTAIHQCKMLNLNIESNQPFMNRLDGIPLGSISRNSRSRFGRFASGIPEATYMNTAHLK